MKSKIPKLVFPPLPEDSDVFDTLHREAIEFMFGMIWNNYFGPKWHKAIYGAIDGYLIPMSKLMDINEDDFDYAGKGHVVLAHYKEGDDEDTREIVCFIDSPRFGYPGIRDFLRHVVARLWPDFPFMYKFAFTDEEMTDDEMRCVKKFVAFTNIDLSFFLPGNEKKLEKEIGYLEKSWMKHARFHLWIHRFEPDLDEEDNGFFDGEGNMYLDKVCPAYGIDETDVIEVEEQDVYIKPEAVRKLKRYIYGN